MDIWDIPPARCQQRHRTDPHPLGKHRQSGDKGGWPNVKCQLRVSAQRRKEITRKRWEGEPEESRHQQFWTCPPQLAPFVALFSSTRLAWTLLFLELYHSQTDWIFLPWIAGHLNSERGNVTLRYNNRRLNNLWWFCYCCSSRSVEYFSHLNYWSVGIDWSERVVILIWHLCRGRLQKRSRSNVFRWLKSFPSETLLKYLHARHSTAIIAALLFTTAVSIYTIELSIIQILLNAR